MLESCNECYLASLGGSKRKSRDSKKSPPFSLCVACTKEIELLKSPIKILKTVTHSSYQFQIYEQCAQLKIDVNDSPDRGFHSSLEGSFLDLKHCEEAIEAWLARPFKMSGTLVVAA